MNQHARQDVQKGRPARPQRARRRGGTDRTLCGPFALAMGLGERKSPPAFPTSEKLRLSVEPPSEARTKLADFFNILLDKASPSGANPAYGQVHLVSRETIRAFSERRTTLLSNGARFGAQALHGRQDRTRWAAGGAGTNGLETMSYCKT